MKSLLQYFVVAYLAVGFVLTLYDGVCLHGIWGFLSGEQDMRDMGFAYRNMLWPVRFF